MRRSSSFATLAFLAVALAACDLHSTGTASRADILPSDRPVDRTDASANPPPDLNALQAQTIQSGQSQTPQQQMPQPSANTGAPVDSYRAAQDAYKAALKKANGEYKADLEKCSALEKAAQKNCKDYANSRFDDAKAEAGKLKPAA